ncbi:hypothetical protein [Croceibacterium ferulae]|uniref:hypothetical protein n=1 Tax=Croceibacterium ferulae TaxID=1854641 RepID=UPI000EB2C77C|nr:hypothetical protein [Croceibacterium ferulae]
MKTLALTAAAPLLFALAACGSSDDASEDAMADTVEMPADEAMAEAPMPAPAAPGDAGMTTDPVADANEPAASSVDTTTEAADAAAAAVADIESEAAAAEAATRAAESSM